MRHHNSPSGTSIKMYGKATGKLATIVDGNFTVPVEFTKTTPDNWVSTIYHFDNMQDGDHQLLGELQSPGYLHLAYFESVAVFSIPPQE